MLCHMWLLWYDIRKVQDMDVNKNTVCSYEMKLHNLSFLLAQSMSESADAVRKKLDALLSMLMQFKIG